MPLALTVPQRRILARSRPGLCRAEDMSTASELGRKAHHNRLAVFVAEWHEALSSTMYLWAARCCEVRRGTDAER